MFILGCQANNKIEEVEAYSAKTKKDVNISDDNISDDNVSDDNATDINISAVYDMYKDYFANDADTPPPVPKFEN